MTLTWRMMKSRTWLMIKYKSFYYDVSNKHIALFTLHFHSTNSKIGYFFPLKHEREYFVKLVLQRWSPATCGSCGSGIIRMQRSSCLSCMEDLINSQSVTLHCSVSPASLCRWNLCNGMVQAGGCWEKSRLASATSDMADMKLYSLVNRPSLIIFKSW